MPSDGTQFGRVPFAMIASGAIRSITGTDAKVLVVIAAHANREMRATIGHRRIADLTGLYKGRVGESIRRLADLEIIAIRDGGGGTRPATLELCAPASGGASADGSAPAQGGASRAQRPGNRELAPRKFERSAPASGGETEEQRNREERTPEQAALPGITPPQASEQDPVAFEFTTSDGKPWRLRRSKLHELRDAYPYVHVDSELDGIRDWLDRNPGKRKPASAMWAWLKRLLAKKQAERPLSAPAFYGDGFGHTELPTDPTGPEVDALLAEIPED